FGEPYDLLEYSAATARLARTSGHGDRGASRSPEESSLRCFLSASRLPGRLFRRVPTGRGAEHRFATVRRPGSESRSKGTCPGPSCPSANLETVRRLLPCWRR